MNSATLALRATALAGVAAAVLACASDGQAQTLFESEANAIIRRSYLELFVQGGIALGERDVRVDPGIGFPASGSFGGGQGFIGFDVRATVARNFFDPGFQADARLIRPNTIVGPGLAAGVKTQFFFGVGGESLSSPFAGFDSVLSIERNFAITPYVSFPFTIIQPSVPTSPQILTISPFAGLTFGQDTVKLRQSGGLFFNSFEAQVNYVAPTFGVDIDVTPNINSPFTWGFTTGVTLGAERSVDGVSSLGFPGDARRDSSVEVFAGVRASFNTPTEFRVGPGLRF